MPVASPLPLFDFEIMVERETGRPRGFGFITFSDRRAVEESIRDMHGVEFGDRTISVNRAEPKFGGGDVDRGFGFSHPLSERDNYGGGGGGGGSDRLVAQDECFKCGKVGHWARECPISGGGGGRSETNDFPYSSSKSKYAPSSLRTERFGGERDRYVEDRYDVGGGGGGRYSERGGDRVEGSRYTSRDRYTTNESRYVSSGGGDRIGGGDRYGGSDRYLQNGYGKDRMYDRDGGMRGGSDRYDKYDRYGGGGAGGGAGGGGGPSRNDRNRGYRGRPDPYDRPTRAGAGRLSSFDRY